MVHDGVGGGYNWLGGLVSSPSVGACILTPAAVVAASLSGSDLRPQEECSGAMGDGLG